MFNLEKSICVWRRQLSARGVKSREILDELESHLREDVAAQIQLGIETSEAFKVAVVRIGNAAVLKVEFAKVGDARRTALPKIFRVSCFIAAPFMVLASAWALLDSETISLGSVFAMFLNTCLACFVGSLPIWHRMLPGSNRIGLKFGFTVASVVVGSFPFVALLDALQVVHLQAGIAVTMFVWCLVASYGATIFAYTCLDLERGAGWGAMRRPSTDELTDDAQRGVENAYAEAARLGHAFVGTEHLLLGIVSLSSGVLMDVLRKWEVDGDLVRTEIENLVEPGTRRNPAHDIPYTPRAMKVMALALQESRRMHHSFVMAEHVFLGLLLEPEGVGGIALRNLGIDADSACVEVAKWLGPDGGDGPQPAVAG